MSYLQTEPCEICEPISDGNQLCFDFMQCRYLDYNCFLCRAGNEYLTPLYASGKRLRNFKAKDYAKNLIFESAPHDLFTSLVMTFLLETHWHYDHMTLSAREIPQKQISDSDSAGLTGLCNIDFLVMTLPEGPENGQYGNMLKPLVETRLRNNVLTWINSQYSLSSGEFRKTYSAEFAEFLQAPPFQNMRLGEALM